MTVAPLSTPVPSGTSPARPTQGEGASDVAGLFALLLAGAQPVQTYTMPGAGPNTPSAPTSARPLPSDFVRASAPPTQPRAPLISGTVGPEQANPLLGAPILPSALPVPAVPARPAGPQAPAQARPEQGGPLRQFAPAGPDSGLPVPVSAPGVERAAPAPALNPTLTEPSPELTLPPGNTAAPLARTIALPTRPATAPFGTRQAASAPAAGPEFTSIGLAVEANVAPAPGGWSRQASPPHALTSVPLAETRPRSSVSAGASSQAAPGSEPHRGPASPLALATGTPAPAADQPAADDRICLEPSTEAPERAVVRFEHAVTDTGRAPSTARPAPPAPMLQLDVHIARALPARIDRLLVQLEPASLGRVEVRLEFHRDNRVSAVIAAERPDTLDALQRDARVLERSLHQAGLRLDSDGLTFSLKREQAHYQQPHEQRPFEPPAGDLGNQPLFAGHRDEPAPLQWFRGLRTLDIRV